MKEFILVMWLIGGLMFAAAYLQSSARHDSIKEYVKAECLK